MAGTMKVQVSADGEHWQDFDPAKLAWSSGGAARLRALASDPRNLRDMGLLLDAANAVELRDRLLAGPPKQ